LAEHSRESATFFCLHERAVKINERLLLMLDLLCSHHIHLDPSLAGSRRTVQAAIQK
jgi:hypothetical protein